jgi:hypothetical protein
MKSFVFILFFHISLFASNENKMIQAMRINNQIILLEQSIQSKISEKQKLLTHESLLPIDRKKMLADLAKVESDIVILNKNKKHLIENQKKLNQ